MADTVYQPHAQQIKFTFGRLPRASPNADAPKAALRHNFLNGFDLSFPGLLCKDDVGPCSECQNDVTVAIESHYARPNGC